VIKIMVHDLVAEDATGPVVFNRVKQEWFAEQFPNIEVEHLPFPSVSVEKQRVLDHGARHRGGGLGHPKHLGGGHRGGDHGWGHGVAAYAATLGTSRRAHLRSAVSLWAKAMKVRVRALVTPDTVDVAQATIMRLEALPEAIPVETPKG
jgi:hypothetical protein